MLKFWNVALLGIALIAPIALAPTALYGADRRSENYHDRSHNDDHQWNSHEEKAYRIWAKENHRKYRQFSKLKDNDRDNYWAWRHDHSDSLLKIEIR